MSQHHFSEAIDMGPPGSDLENFLARYGLAAPGASACWTSLTGGVSSDIWRVDVGERSFCVKRALPKLRVAADWRVSTDRNAYEWEYIEFIASFLPNAVPEPLAHDAGLGVFAMGWLAPDEHVLWKSELLAGRVNPAHAALVGSLLGEIHARSTRNQELLRRFATDDNFDAIRIDPYLRASAQSHPDLAAEITTVAEKTLATHLVLVHGDVSPKNIMLGPHGPVLLDAECAWWGDPAFDLAFCLTHMVTKQLARPDRSAELLACFDQLVDSYMAHVDWESVGGLEARAAALLPILALARVDGKSPVEYLTESQRRPLRSRARSAILLRLQSLGAVCSILMDK